MRPKVSGLTSARPHSTHTAEERANASSGEQLAGPGAPEGRPQGPAVCLPCRLEAVEGKGPWQGQGSHGPSRTPLPRSRGALPALLCLLAGAVHRDAVLSPGASVLEAFLFLLDMIVR